MTRGSGRCRLAPPRAPKTAPLAAAAYRVPMMNSPKITPRSGREDCRHYIGLSLPRWSLMLLSTLNAMGRIRQRGRRSREIFPPHSSHTPYAPLSIRSIAAWTCSRMPCSACAGAMCFGVRAGDIAEMRTRVGHLTRRMSVFGNGLLDAGKIGDRRSRISMSTERYF